MRKVIVTTAALVTQGAAESAQGEVPAFPEGRLSARERDVLAMISQGLSNKRIARAREISPETVKSHVKHIFLKLLVSTRAQAVSQAGALGLLPAGNLRQEEDRRGAAVAKP